MSWELTDDVEHFAATTGDFLRSRPVPHTMLLTLVDTLRRRGPHAYGPDDPVFGWWRTSAGAVGGVLLQTPPRPVMFSELPPEAVAAAVAALAGRPLRGVNLLAGAAEVFAEEWRRRTGATTTVGMRIRLHRLETLIPPAELPPELRGQGYATAATAASTRAALAAGARDVVLHTDLANPISNRLYRKLGYRPVEDRTVVEFSS